jgi:hypothetical protein
MPKKILKIFSNKTFELLLSNSVQWFLKKLQEMAKRIKSKADF